MGGLANLIESIFESRWAELVIVDEGLFYFVYLIFFEASAVQIRGVAWTLHTVSIYTHHH